VTSSGAYIKSEKLISMCNEIELDIRIIYRKKLIEQYKARHTYLTNTRFKRFIAKIFKLNKECALTPEIEKYMLENPMDSIPEFMSVFSKSMSIQKDICMEEEIRINEIAAKIRMIAKFGETKEVFISINDWGILCSYKYKMENKSL